MDPLTWITPSPDGALLGIGSQSGRCFLWSVREQTVVHAFAAGDFVVRAAWTPDGARLLVAARDGRLLVLRGDGRATLGEIATGHGQLRSLAVRADGRAWATCGTDGAVRVWDPETLAKGFELNDGHTGAFAVGFARGSVVAGFEDGFFSAWSEDGREKLASGPIVARPPVYSLAVHPAGDRMVFGGGKGGLQEVLVGPPGEWRAGARWTEPPRPIAVNALDFAADGSFVAACSDDAARLYKSTADILGTTLGMPFYLRSPKPAWEQGFIVSGACFVPGSRLLATCHWNGTLRLWRDAACVGTFTPATQAPAPRAQPSPAPDARSADAGGVLVQLGTAAVALQLSGEADVTGLPAPTMAFAPLRCAACGTVSVAAAPVRYVFYDDDHFGRMDLWYRSGHARPCSHCGAALGVELRYTVSQNQLRERASLTLDGADALAGAALAPVADLQVPAVALHMARSSAECHLFMALRPCACGRAGAPPRHEILASGVGLLARYHGACSGCGEPREFHFVLDPEIPPQDAFGGAGPSPLLCPGEFALHSDRLAKRWPADPKGLSAAERQQARHDLLWAIRALEEVLKFIPARAVQVPADAFSSKAGQEEYQAEPDRFRKARLETRLATYRQLLPALEQGT